MTSKINPREVLSYLNQLGYTNINAAQLQAFIKDLKKLMKYEEQKEKQPQVIKVNILNEMVEGFGSTSSFAPKNERTEAESSVTTKTKNNLALSESSSTLPEKENIIDSKVLPRRPSTVPAHLVSVSKPKQSLKRTNQSLESTSNSTITCPVHFLRGIGCPETARSKSVGTACTCPVDASSQVSSSCVKDKVNKKGKRPVCSTIEAKVDTSASCSYPNSFDDKTYYSRYCPKGKKTIKSAGRRNYTHDFTHPCYCPGSMKPRSAVIKCNIGCKPTFPKCDPVNLHKYYQRQWQINRIPGENMPREQRFRWCFREKISCGPPEYGGTNFQFLPKFGF